MYYLNSRYYDPEIGRFVNADDISFLDPESINGLNLYAYCGDNPVMYIDPTGRAWWHWLLGIGGVLVVAATTVLTLGAAGVAIGGLAGAIIHGAAVGALIGAGVGAVGGAVAGGIYSAVTGEDFWTSVGIGAAAGFGIGAIAGAVIGGAYGYFNYIPSQITGFTKHGQNQVISRDGHGVANKAILETMKSSKIVIQGTLRKTYKYIGKNAVVILNKAGKVITAWAKHKAGRRIGGVLIWLLLSSIYEN